MVIAEHNWDYEPRGGALELFEAREDEILYEGPAGTGKTRAVLQRCHWLAQAFTQLRMLWVRKTRKSMTESVLVTWHEKVLPPTHPFNLQQLSKGHRDSYTYENGSHIVLGGMDNADRFMSTEFDVIVAYEAIEFTVEDWEKLLTRLRNDRLPWQQAIADTNPGATGHWLNRRANGKAMRRILSRHTDNPSVTPKYLARLGRLTGARRGRYFLGHWVSESGTIWEEFDEARHMANGPPIDDNGKPAFKAYFGSVDWGFRGPGTLQWWGIDRENDMWLVAEIYKQGRQLDWWVGEIEKLHKELPAKSIVCDPSEPGGVDRVNQLLGRLGGRGTHSLAIKADNDVLPGIDCVRYGFTQNRIHLIRDVLRCGMEEDLHEAGLPVCLKDEIPSYVWMKAEDGRALKEKPDKINDHGCDALRYAAMFLWGRNFGRLKKNEPYPEGSFGDVLGHNKKHRRRLVA